MKDQPPSGGCENCGATVRTRKYHGWVCARCNRKLERQAAARATRTYHSDRLGTVTIPEDDR